MVLAISLCGAATLYALRSGGGRAREWLFYVLLFLFMALVNPIFYHNGVTVLFVVDDNPVTLEALVYGVAASAMIIAVLLWFRSFSQIMTSDRLLYLFGTASPKLALLLSMALRYIPLFGAQSKHVGDTQKALGLYKEDNIVDDIRGGARVFSVMVGWALENGIITADSMSARGYGLGKRSFFALYRFRRADAVLMALTMAFFIITIVGVVTGALSFNFYPKISSPPTSPWSAAAYISYAALAFIPAIIEAGEGLKWKYLQSKI
jgi:ABC-type cobalt transport system, permease component CbiQ and related transporters